ncbi:carbohydrate kinase family protein [Nakamurella alba]|uniref:carbohydrate kinase family protein n=1 Tax=Nakamurella alba TaxID=2665158 RepID=UPI002AC371C1|nr:PfkB family carbohydrate kinase [Nakamurella alba]
MSDLDVFMQGTVFFDMVLTGLPTLPQPGTEMHAEGMGSCPGGIANLAVAASRLGLRAGLASTFGDDVYGDFLWGTLAEEGVDLSRSRRISDWHSPVTVSLAVHRDRAMVTHGHPSPVPVDELVPSAPEAAAGVVTLGEMDQVWVREAHRKGVKLFGDVGWDPSEQWSTDVLDQLTSLHAFMPNSVEAMAYSRTEDPRAALLHLADLVPVVVVTCGGQGAIGIDSNTGEEEWVPSLPVNAVDATGAGDVFAAAFLLGSLREWPLRNRMAFANLCAALSVQQVGGSLAAPGWGDIIDWISGVRAAAAQGSRAAAVLGHSYEFLDEELTRHQHTSVRRAVATVARFSDA